MIVAEILAYDTDIICLQEVDGSIYDSLLRPVFEAMGYQGYYTNKISIQKEGCAMFWSLARFEAADESHMNSFGIRDLFTSGEMSNWDMTGIHQLLSKKDELRQVALEKTGQVLQIATLKPKYISDDEHLPERMVLANTHLFYHPMADHVRALQAYVVARKIDQVRCSTGSFHAPFILCGDLNSDPLSGAAQLLLTRCVRPEHRDCWKNLNTYKWEMGESEYLIEHQYVGNRPDHTDLVYEEEAFQTAHGDLESLHEINNHDDDTTPPIIQLPDTFPTIISGCREIPIFTNYAVDFKETLDYALASTIAKGEPYGFISKNCALMPSVEEVASYIAMPNECMPSDHVAILCDFEWTSASSSDRLGI
jgi:2',5'-phosphodiesterase